MNSFQVSLLNSFKFNQISKFSYEKIKTEEFVVNSSRHRKQRAIQMKPPTCLEDLFELASDETDKDYPIFRSPGRNNQIHCVATGKKST